MKLFPFLIAILTSFFISNTAQAYEVKKVCAKYETNYKMSKAYSVQAQIYDGSELNEAVGSFSRFNMFDHYAVIWWDQGQASVIKLRSYFPGSMMYRTTGTDQNGRKWELSDNSTGYCM